MATTRWFCRFIAGLFVIICTFSVEAQDPATDILTEKNVDKWANALNKDLDLFFSQITPFTQIQKKYENYDRSMIEFSVVNGTELAETMSASLGNILGKKVKGLKYAVEEAEAIAKKYKWNGKLKTAVHVTGQDVDVAIANKIGSVEYINSQMLKRDDPRLVFNEMFRQKVNLRQSSVHIPVEIYEGNINILNGLNWTTELDRVFQKNRKMDPDLLWQYFGSQTGFLRTFPASHWRCYGAVDLYDVRRRPWYTQGSSSPKDMLILIDTSGSVHGQALQLIKVSVQSLLDTLGDNDFFNIISFSSKASYVYDCFNETFVQANYRNKRILQEQVAQLQAKGKADFSVGLTFAFQEFERFRQNDTMNHGAKCNEVIMLLTDGGSDKAKEVFEKYNWPNNKSVRVFTYTIGSTSDPTESIRWMACANRGFFSPIPAMGAIRSKVQVSFEDIVKPADYMSFLKRGKEYLLIQSPEWFVNYYDLGLGMVTTVTLPVYNRSLDATNQTILGVMGVDVTTRTLMEYTPTRKLTPNGYSFAINQNGYIIFHPDLKAQHPLQICMLMVTWKFWNDMMNQSKNGWLQDPPNVDFLDLELETTKKDKMRTRMIDGETGQENIYSFYVESDNKHIIRVNRTYSFTSIPNSDFSLCIVTPMYGKVYPVFKTPMPLDKGFGYLKSNKSAMLIPKWDYYKNYKRQNASLVNGTTQDLVNAHNRQQQPQWTEDLLQHLFWDANVTQNLETFGRLTQGIFKNIWQGVFAVFIGTASGLTRVFPLYCEHCPSWNCDNKTAADRLSEDRDTWKAVYYKRALDTDNLLFMASPSPDDELEDMNVTEFIPEVTVVKSVSITSQGLKYKPAVIGVKLEHSLLLEYLMNATKDTGEESLCNDTENLVCFLLDDGGFVIATNQPDQYRQVGMFLGKVDNALMFALSPEGEEADGRFYLSKERHDYQASCPDQDEQSSMAGLRSLRIPSITMVYEMLSLNWWSSQLTWAYVNFNVYSWFTSSMSVYAQDDAVPQEDLPDTVMDGEEEKELVEPESDCTPVEGDEKRNHSCTKVEAQYYYIPDKTKGHGTIYCGNCTRMHMYNYIPDTTKGYATIYFVNCTRVFSAARLQNSNLLLVISDQECLTYECEDHIIIQEPQEDESPNECTLNLRYRRRPKGCYSRDAWEDDSHCGGATHVPSRVWILVATTITLIVSLSCTSLFT